jgi:uncharacterized membrane protein
MNWLAFAMRWFHLVAVITLIGGTIFMRFALTPAASALPAEQDELVRQQVRRRWSKLVMATIAFLLISGVVNYMIFWRDSHSGTPEWDAWLQKSNGLYQAMFGMKFILAMIIFFIASALAGRGEATKKFRQDAKWWLSVNVALALVVIALSGVMRLTHTGPTPTSPTAATSQGSGNG